MDQTAKVLGNKEAAFSKVIGNIGKVDSKLSGSEQDLKKAKEEAERLEEKLSKLIGELKGVTQEEQYQKLISLIKNDPGYLADFISSPVDVTEKYIYPVENNGSMTAPFYIVLSIWVGALIMSTILKTEVHDKSNLKNVKNWQCFVGRFFTTYVVGQIQTIITVFGALFFVGIQCKHPVLMMIACLWTTFVFDLLLYSFTYSFGNVGEALSVILMVIQVAGAGGTFPIEVLPQVFQKLYTFMPFNYAMNAVRECIAGRYQNDYWWYLLTLLVYVVIAVAIGVLLYYPCKKLNDKVEKSKDNSGILI
jgi:putative membrane protein